MPSLLVTLRDILLLRRGPQDLPYSLVLLAIAVVARLLLSQWLATFQPPQTQSGLLISIVGTALDLGLLYLLLNALQRQSRFVQTATAILLVDVIAATVLLPLLHVIEPVLNVMATPGATPEAVAAAMNGAIALAALLFVAVGVWNLVVNSHILRQALEIRLMPALLITMALEFAGQIVLSALFGGAEGN
jgi:hypothetical protein